MLMKKLLLFLIGGILLIGTYGCANYEEDFWTKFRRNKC